MLQCYSSLFPVPCSLFAIPCSLLRVTASWEHDAAMLPPRSTHPRESVWRDNMSARWPTVLRT